MVNLAENKACVCWIDIPQGLANVDQRNVNIHKTWKACIVFLALSDTKHNKPQFDNKQKHEKSEQPKKKFHQHRRPGKGMFSAVLIIGFKC